MFMARFPVEPLRGYISPFQARRLKFSRPWNVRHASGVLGNCPVKLPKLVARGRRLSNDKPRILKGSARAGRGRSTALSLRDVPIQIDEIVGVEAPPRG